MVTPDLSLSVIDRQALFSVLLGMRLFPPVHRSDGRRPRLPQSLPLGLSPLRNLHSRIRSRPNSHPTHRLPSPPGSLHRSLSPVRRRNPVVVVPHGSDAQLGFRGSGGGTASGVCVGDGVEWGVYFKVELEVGFLLFCWGEFGGLGGGVVGVAERERGI